ncbi:T3SS effector HopA1 family protein [Sorangium sp. So ce321]|uniref:T3SS effector HopA1 family protein n=1 Tax=Sorangium sp. So ce321 TaxID=3133300 RepID=UPI003F5EAD0B
MMALCDASPYHQVLRRIAAEVSVTSESDYAHVPDATVLPALDLSHELLPPPASPSWPAVLQGLSNFIYAYYYLGDPSETRNARRKGLTPSPIVLREDAEFGASLRTANRGKGYADPGWRVRGTERGAVVVEKNRISLLAREGDIVEQPTRLGPGDEVTLRFPNDRPYAYPGYYMAVGDGGPATHELQRELLRIYFDVRPQGAPALIAALTGGMGAALTKFSVKVLNNPLAYTRPDAAVAFMLRDEYPRARGMLKDVVDALRPDLGERVPAFACPIASGVGVAEEPPSEGPVRTSFGQHRCVIVARGLVRAFRDGVEDASIRLLYILRELDATGIDSSRPYLNPRSAGVYAPLDDVGPSGRLRAGASSAASATSDGE